MVERGVTPADVVVWHVEHDRCVAVETVPCRVASTMWEHGDFPGSDTPDRAITELERALPLCDHVEPETVGHGWHGQAPRGGELGEAIEHAIHAEVMQRLGQRIFICQTGVEALGTQTVEGRGDRVFPGSGHRCHPSSMDINGAAAAMVNAMAPVQRPSSEAPTVMAEAASTAVERIANGSSSRPARSCASFPLAPFGRSSRPPSRAHRDQ